MTPVDQSIMHDPANGQWGDCMRACIASLLALPILDVPHFNEGGPRGLEFDRRVRDFLAQHGLIEVRIHSKTSQAHVIQGTCHHLIYGYTERGTYHAVVGLNGKVVHDPHPSKTGVIEDDRIEHAFLVFTGSKPKDDHGSR